MKRSKIQLSLRHLKIVVMLIIVVFSNDIMCQKRHLRRPTNPKSLGFSKSLQSVLPYNSNNNRSGGGSKPWPFKFVNKSSKQPKLKKELKTQEKTLWLLYLICFSAVSAYKPTKPVYTFHTTTPLPVEAPVTTVVTEGRPIFCAICKWGI